MLSGCEGEMAVKKDEAPQAAAAKPEAKAVVTDDAKQALSKAEADVKAAKAKGALWTTAEDALNKAKEAVEKGDSNAVLKHAKTASEHAQLGLEQLKYPMTY
jgi:murein lipoprotein